MNVCLIVTRGENVQYVKGGRGFAQGNGRVEVGVGASTPYRTASGIWAAAGGQGQRLTNARVVRRSKAEAALDFIGLDTGPLTPVLAPREPLFPQVKKFNHRLISVPRVLRSSHIPMLRPSLTIRP